MAFALLLENEAPHLAEVKTEYSLQSISCLEATISILSLRLRLSLS